MNPTRSRLAPWRAAALVALLLLAQALGFAHAVAHGPANAAAAVQPGADDEHGHAAGSAECRVVDAHGWLDLATGGSWATEPAPAAEPAGAQRPAPRASVAPRWARPARGPPR